MPSSQGIAVVELCIPFCRVFCHKVCAQATVIIRQTSSYYLLYLSVMQVYTGAKQCHVQR